MKPTQQRGVIPTKVLQHNLGINDKISLKSMQMDHFNIEGLALSSEHIYSIKGNTMIMPILVNTVYNYSEDMLKGIYGQKYITRFVLLTRAMFRK